MANQADRLVVGNYRKKSAVIPGCVGYTELQQHEELREEMGVAFTCAGPTVTVYLLVNYQCYDNNMEATGNNSATK